jgi:hypothetical protein
MSFDTIARNAHAAEPPEAGPAAIVLGVWLVWLNASVPVFVMGEPVTARDAGVVIATLDTVPPPASNALNVTDVDPTTIGVVIVEYTQYV